MPPVVSETSEVIENLVRRAYKRHLILLGLDELGFAAVFLFSGLILLLLFGTDLLSWYWLPFIAAVGVAIALFRLRRRTKSRYRVAQTLDARLSLDDSISTAWFLLSNQNLNSDGLARKYVFDTSERIARNVDPARALPLEGARIWSIAGSIAAVAVTLFVLRYGVTKTLDLRPTIYPLSFPSIVAEVEQALHLPGQKLSSDKGSELPNAFGNEHDSTIERSKEPPFKPYGLTPAEAGINRSSDPDSFSAARENGSSQAGQTNEMYSGSLSARAGQHPKAGSPDQRGSQSKLEQQNKGPSAGKSNQGLMERMEGALSSLMAELKPSGKSRSGEQQNEQGGQNRQKSADQMGSSPNQNGDPQQGTGDTRATAQETAASSAQAAAAERLQSAKSRSNSPSSSNKSSNSQSGIGHENGAKDLQDADELKAMGKLAEIIGKRSAETTGDATIETSSGNQQLKTQYTGRLGEHSDRGGEIDRDQIPMEYRDYVKQYMERVRKQTDKTD